MGDLLFKHFTDNNTVQLVKKIWLINVRHKKERRGVRTTDSDIISYILYSDVGVVILSS